MSEKIKNPVQRKIGLVFWLSVIALVILLCLRIHIKGFNGSGVGVGSVTLEEQVASTNASPEKVKSHSDLRRIELEQKKLESEVRGRVAKYNGDVAAIVERYRSMIPLSEAEICFSTCKDGARFIASKEGLCGFKVCASLAYKMAYDKVKKTNRTEDAIVPVVKERLIPHLQEGCEKYAEWSKRFIDEMMLERQTLAYDLALKCQDFQTAIVVIPDEAAQMIQSATTNLIAQIEEHAKESAFAAVGAGIEAVMIRSSFAAIQKCVISVGRSCLAPIAAKLVSTAGTATVSAVADGPLPIGDIIGGVVAIGGTVWTAYDIYRVTEAMPKEMEDGITKSIDEFQRSLTTAALENLKKCESESQSYADEQLKIILKTIKGN